MPTTGWRSSVLPKGAGSMVSFGVKGGRAAGRRFIEACELASHLANVGDAKTLVIHPASTTHLQVGAAALAAAGVGEDMIRLSVGLEDPADIIADLDARAAARAEGLRAGRWRSTSIGAAVFLADYGKGLEPRAPDHPVRPRRRHGPLGLAAAGAPFRLSRLERAGARPARPWPERRRAVRHRSARMADWLWRLIRTLEVAAGHAGRPFDGRLDQPRGGGAPSPEDRRRWRCSARRPRCRSIRRCWRPPAGRSRAPPS